MPGSTALPSVIETSLSLVIPGSERQWIIILLNIQDATSFRYKRECSLTGSTGLANTLESSQTIYTLAPIGRKEILWLTPSNVVRKLRGSQALSVIEVVSNREKLEKNCPNATRYRSKAQCLLGGTVALSQPARYCLDSLPPSATGQCAKT